MISKEDVKNIASLSRIHLQEDEAEALSKDLEKILDYINQLEELDITAVEPTSHVLSLKNAFREDIVQTPLSQEEALSFSIESKEGSFKVPPIIE